MDARTWDLALGWERVSCQGTMTCSWMPHTLWWLPLLHFRLVLLSAREVEMGCFLEHLEGLEVILGKVMS